MKIYIKEFKNKILNHDFFEAHEVFEGLWFPIRYNKDEYCLTLKGFINIAVSLELYKRGRKEQSKKVFKNYKKYITHNRIKKTKYISDFLELQSFMDEFYHKYTS
jgi:predicted metal-dependent hydrolase